MLGSRLACMEQLRSDKVLIKTHKWAPLRGCESQRGNIDLPRSTGCKVIATAMNTLCRKQSSSLLGSLPNEGRLSLDDLLPHALDLRRD